MLSFALSLAYRWRRYRNTIQMLSDMSDNQLSDIGIKRGDIVTVVHSHLSR
jgi:uncharacterized protein YjiS (DUF1127 family)